MVVYQTATSTHRPPGLHGTALRPPGDGVRMFWSVLGPPEGAVRAMAMTLDFTGGFLRHPAHLQLIPCHPCRAAPAVLLLWVAKSSPGGRVRVSESAVCCCGCAQWSPAMSTSGGDVELRVQAVCVAGSRRVARSSCQRRRFPSCACGGARARMAGARGWQAWVTAVRGCGCDTVYVNNSAVSSLHADHVYTHSTCHSQLGGSGKPSRKVRVELELWWCLAHQSLAGR